MVVVIPSTERTQALDERRVEGRRHQIKEPLRNRVEAMRRRATRDASVSSTS
jgi:hypothetical protein